MRTAPIKELSFEAFHAYGSFANMLNPQALHIGAKPIEFFRDMIPLNLAHSRIASFSVCRVEKRPPVVDVTEYHSSCAEGILPLDGDVLIHVGPATPPGIVPCQEFEIFRVPQGTMVALHPGVWHHAPFVHGNDAVNVLIVLPERTYANDCTVVELSEEQQITVES